MPFLGRFTIEFGQVQSEKASKMLGDANVTTSLICLHGWFVQVRVVPKRTVVGDIDQRFDNLSLSHH